ncbi:MAG: transposase, partial [Deltaproteobacteria bacterium]|nr:transposase [Deltaproteobacteria bacterium]
MYSQSDRMKAIEVYIRYGKSAAATIRSLGYPSKKQIQRWYRSYSASGQALSRKKRKAKYSSVERRRAVEHYFLTGKCLARTVRELGYPSKAWLRAWINGETPLATTTRVKLVPRPDRPDAERKRAVLDLCARQRSAAEVAQQFGVSRQALYKWRNQLLGANTVSTMKRRPSLKIDDNCVGLRAEVEALEKRIHELQLEHDILIKANEILKKDEGVSLGSLSNREKAQLIDALKDSYRLPELLSGLDLSRSSYYYACAALKQPDKYAGVRQEMATIFESNYRSYGYRRVGECLRRIGSQISEKVIRRLMAE